MLSKNPYGVVKPKVKEFLAVVGAHIGIRRLKIGSGTYHYELCAAYVMRAGSRVGTGIPGHYELSVWDGSACLAKVQHIHWHNGLALLALLYEQIELNAGGTVERKKIPGSAHVARALRGCFVHPPNVPIEFPEDDHEDDYDD